MNGKEWERMGKDGKGWEKENLAMTTPIPNRHFKCRRVLVAYLL